MENYQSWTVEHWRKQSEEQSFKSDDALITLYAKAFETIHVVANSNSDSSRIELSIASLDQYQKIAMQYEKENRFDILRRLSFGLIESLHILLVMKGKVNGDQNQKLIIVEPNDESIERMRQAVEKWRKKSLKYSGQSSDALINLCSRTFRTISIVLSQDANNTRIKRELTFLNGDRELTLKHEKDSNIVRKFSFGLIMALQVLLEKIGKINGDQNQTDQALNSSSVIMELKEEPIDLTVQIEEPIDPNVQILGGNEDQKTLSDVVETKEEPIDPTDQIIEGNEIPLMEDDSGYMFKEEEIDLKFETNDTSDPVQKSSNQLPSNDKDSVGNIEPSEIMGDQMNSMGDPIIDDQNHISIPIEKESLENISSSGENEKEVAKTEMIGEANYSIGEVVEKDKTANGVSDASKESSKTGEAEKRTRPSRRKSKVVNYTESIDQSEEPLEKKPRIKPEKKIDNKRRSNSNDKGDSEQTVLECPNCEYRTLSVRSWVTHLSRVHSTTPRKLGVALLCECGNESFSKNHIRQCDIAKITVVRKSATPQCVMCEMHPKTAVSYALHLERHHDTSMLQMGIFLTCSCGHKVRSSRGNPEHTKKCNGHEFTLHKVDED